MTTQILLLIAIPLETTRMVLLCRDIRDIAKSKGEPPIKWMVGTVFIWLSIELITLLVWRYYSPNYLLVAGLLFGIILAGIVYFFYKRILTQKPDRDFEGMIDEIGKSGE